MSNQEPNAPNQGPALPDQGPASPNQEATQTGNLYDLKIDPEFPDIVNVIIEIPAGGVDRVEYNPETNEFYPAHRMKKACPSNYGWIPETFAEDGEFADIIVLGPVLATGTICRVKPIGVFWRQNRDHKVVAVPLDVPELERYKDASELPGEFFTECDRFFRRHSGDLLLGEGTARIMIKDAVKAYRRQESQRRLKEQVREMADVIALLHYHLAKAVADRFGDEGLEAIRQGIRAFGLERGRRIREKVLSRGLEPNLENLAAFYDLPLAAAWEATKEVSGDTSESRITRCPFAQVWTEKKAQDLGLLYCEVDPALMAGYNPEIKFSRPESVLEGAGRCVLPLHGRRPSG